VTTDGAEDGHECQLLECASMNEITKQGRRER
jgi:hypothetical protein